MSQALPAPQALPQYDEPILVVACVALVAGVYVRSQHRVPWYGSAEAFGYVLLGEVHVPAVRLVQTVITFRSQYALAFSSNMPALLGSLPLFRAGAHDGSFPLLRLGEHASLPLQKSLLENFWSLHKYV